MTDEELLLAIEEWALTDSPPHDSFVQSLREQLDAYGSFTDSQREALENIYEKWIEKN